jgi:hypothetical protein
MPHRFELALVVADIISAHCPGTSARARFIQSCIGTEWDEAASMIEGMLADPSRLRGYQEKRLREFLDLMSRVVPVDQRALTVDVSGL